MKFRDPKEQKHHLKMIYTKGNMIKIDHLTLLHYRQPNKKFVYYFYVKWMNQTLFVVFYVLNTMNSDFNVKIICHVRRFYLVPNRT